MKNTLGNHAAPNILKAAISLVPNDIYYLCWLKSDQDTLQFKACLDATHNHIDVLYRWRETELEGYVFNEHSSKLLALSRLSFSIHKEAMVHNIYP